MREYVLKPHETRPALVPGCAAEPRAGTDAVGPGLSKGHIDTNLDSKSTKDSSSYLHSWEGAGLLRVKNPYHGELQPPNNKVKRGEIKGHSLKSRSRARMFLSKIPNEDIMNGLLITLTYPGNQAADKVPEASEYAVYKYHLRRFNQSVLRIWNGCGLWFLEFQERGAPHYHLIVFGIAHSDLEKFQEWVSAEWNRIIEGGADHLEAGTRVEIPKNHQAARNYVTAYFTKGSQALEETKVGRYWGKFGTASIPLAPEVVEKLTPIQAKVATRTCRKAVERRVWTSAWHRAKAQAGKVIPSIRYLSALEFRTLCENCRKGKNSSFVNESGGTSTYAYVILDVIASCMGVERFKFPHRHRNRNNCTVNLYCDASSFCAALKRHPLWGDESRSCSKRFKSEVFSG